MTKIDPTRMCYYFMTIYGTVWGNISQKNQVSDSSHRKCKKGKSHLLSRQGYPGRITEEGGTRAQKQEVLKAIIDTPLN